MTESRLRRVALAAGAIALMAGMVGCAGNTVADLPAELIVSAGSIYRLGLGDKVRVNVYGERDLSGEFQVSGNGSIDMPLIGAIKAQGLSAMELQTALTQRLKQGFLTSPQVNVEVYDFRPYYVLGEVQNAGKYPATEETSLLGAIATAGGFSYRAEQSKIFIRRAGSSVEYRVPEGTNLIIRPGDVIRVGERYL